MIFHITKKNTWEKALANKCFRTESLNTEGFIHCSPIEKIPEVVNNFYKGQTELVLLCIDESKVKSKIIREDLYGHGFEYPHIYGELNLDAVINTEDLHCSKDSLFILPDNI